MTTKKTWKKPEIILISSDIEKTRPDAREGTYIGLTGVPVNPNIHTLQFVKTTFSTPITVTFQDFIS